MKEVDQVKELYVKVCAEKDLLEERMKEEGETAVSKKLQEVSNHMNTHTDPPPKHKHPWLIV